MIRNLKVLGLALVAVCAMSAMVASAASAASFTTTSGATLTGTETTQHKFTVTGQTVTCSDVLFHATAPAASFESVTVSPRYTECKTNLGTTVNVTGFGHLAAEAGKAKCDYVLNSSATSKAKGDPADRPIAELNCESGAEVTVDAGPCVVHLGSQGFNSGVTYTNNSSGAKKDIDIDFNVTGITGNHTDGFLCPFGSSGHNAEAVLEGTATVTAEVAGAQVDGTFDP